MSFIVTMKITGGNALLGEMWYLFTSGRMPCSTDHARDQPMTGPGEINRVISSFAESDKGL